MSTRLLLVLGVLHLLATSRAAAQSHEHDAAAEGSAAARAFVARARAATEQYHDQRLAIRAGFRRLGPDFPAMGEHWINVGRVFDPAFDPALPAMLSYATIDGRPRLIGVVYVRALVGDEQAPDEPAGCEAWHDHARSVDEEALALEHLAKPTGGGSRLALLHAWIWLDNPRGMFAADNWALPFARLGLAVPERFSTDAAKALALLSGGDAHLARVIDGMARTAPRERALVAGILERRRNAVGALVAGRSALDPPTLDALAAEWGTLWHELAASSPVLAAKVQHLRTR